MKIQQANHGCRKVRRQFLIAAHRVGRCDLTGAIDSDNPDVSLPVRGSLSYTPRESCFLHFHETLRIFYNRRGVDIRLMNESTLDSAHARSGSITLFPGFSAFFPSPAYFVTRRRLYTVKGKREFLQGDRSDGFCFPRILKYWNYIRYVDPIWSKMKEQLWFTVARHWLRYLFALRIDRSTSLVAA